MKCPKCGTEMSMGAPHGDGYTYQFECHNCGKIIKAVCSSAPAG